jgi:hypothetical protein
MMKNIFLISIILLNINLFSQENYKYRIGRTWNDVTKMEEYSIIKNNSDTIRKLDSEKYIGSLQVEFNNFAIFSIKGKKGWSAIDINENLLFQVYNRVPGEPFPDYLVENRIRIVGENNKIGFANSNGEIVIKPQFETITEFNNGFAIFQSDCVKIENDINRNQHSGFHYECKKIGYIDQNGKIIEVGEFDLIEIKERIMWNGKD